MRRTRLRWVVLAAAAATLATRRGRKLIRRSVAAYLADDKGFAYYSDSAGWWYGTATSVRVADAETAHMTVTVTESTHSAVAVGSVITFYYYDLGEPGTNDWFSVGGSGHYTAEAGNIQVTTASGMACTRRAAISAAPACGNSESGTRTMCTTALTAAQRRRSGC